ncbi:MAG: hypothetical protein R3F41_18140 [Gammaproteobacteria bacterium]|nr:hypothetical protein [Pseudomonadales bacterium]
MKTMTNNIPETQEGFKFPALIEPLDLLARFSWSWAPLLCRSQHGCQEYHRCWSLVRLIKKEGALPAGLEFFKHHLTDLVDQGRTRVLISGAADTGLLALVCTIFSIVNAKPEILLMDRCRTTLIQNRILAEYLGLEIETIEGDIRKVDIEPVDAIIAHSFLTFFVKADRQDVINAWASILNPGGKILMSANIATSEAVKSPAISDSRIQKAKQELIIAAAALGMNDSESQALGKIAAHNWQKKWAYDPYLTVENLNSAFSLAGISLDEVTLKENEHLGPFAQFKNVSKKIQRGEIAGTRLA